MNNTSLAIINGQELDTIQRTGKLLAASGYFDGKGESAQAIAMMATKIMAGREMGFGPLASVNGVHIIKGKPCIGANLMASAVKGYARYDYRVKEMSNQKCVIEFFEREGDKKVSIGVSEFTFAEATTAGLTSNDTWKKFPRNMLFARALSNGVRWYCPDVFSGNAVYVPEEMGAEVDGEGNIIESTYTVTKPVMAVERIVDATTGEIVLQGASGDVDGDAIFATETPPHQRMWGQGMGVFGPDWDMSRPWLISKWTGKVTPDNTRNSASELNDDEKDALADYLKANVTALQGIWRKQKASMLQGNGVAA